MYSGQWAIGARARAALPPRTLAERPSVRISATGALPATTHLQGAASSGRTKHLKEKARVSGLVRQKRQAAKLSRRGTARAAAHLLGLSTLHSEGPESAMVALYVTLSCSGSHGHAPRPTLASILPRRPGCPRPAARACAPRARTRQPSRASIINPSHTTTMHPTDMHVTAQQANGLGGIFRKEIGRSLLANEGC